MKWERELETAVRAVTAAAAVCERVQKSIGPPTLTKADASPVTVADFASQAVVCALLTEAFPGDAVVGEENSAALRGDQAGDLRATVTRLVGEGLGRSVEASDALAWIDRGQRAPGAGRFWALDPIDGTKGFLRREQYAVALGLIVQGRVMLGVLACPNYPVARGVGLLTTAVRGEGTWETPLAKAPGITPTRIGLNNRPAGGTVARFCESVEPGHSDQAAAARIAAALGITQPPLRMDSQAKYAAVARGDAVLYLRMPRNDAYRENIWDHAAGSVIVEEAGGTVTDITGKPLDFSHGRQLLQNRGVVASIGIRHAAVIETADAGV